MGSLESSETRTTIEGCSPIWAEYVWLARSDGSRLYPVIRKFLAAVESSSRSAGFHAVNEYRRRVKRTLMKHRLKYFIYSACGWHTKKSKYYDRLCHELPRTIRDAALNVGVRSLKGGLLTQAMVRCGSDKGSAHRNYTRFYELLFDDDRARVARVFEMGIGLLSPDAGPGASLKGWKEYFPNALIFGGDIDERLLFEDDRIKTGIVDQTDPDSVDRIFQRFGGQFDLIVDDGYHQLEANRTFFERGFRQLKDNGIYVIEDIVSRRRDDYKPFLRGYDAVILEIPANWNHQDNCLALIAKD